MSVSGCGVYGSYEGEPLRGELPLLKSEQMCQIDARSIDITDGEVTVLEAEEQVRLVAGQVTQVLLSLEPASLDALGEDEGPEPGDVLDVEDMEQQLATFTELLERFPEGSSGREAIEGARGHRLSRLDMYDQFEAMRELDEAEQAGEIDPIEAVRVKSELMNEQLEALGLDPIELPELPEPR